MTVRTFALALASLASEEYPCRARKPIAERIARIATTTMSSASENQPGIRRGFFASFALLRFMVPWIKR